MLLAGRFKCPSPANPGNKTPFGASVFMHQLLCAWAFVRVLNTKFDEIGKCRCERLQWRGERDVEPRHVPIDARFSLNWRQKCLRVF